MLVSILINNYNYGRFLADCIRSAIGQTYQPIEVIVVDDGSTDDSLEIANTFSDQIKIISKANGGQGSAYNAGFKASSGQVIIFLDSDDLLLPNVVKDATKLFNDSAVAKVQWRLTLMNEQGVPTGELFPETLHDSNIQTIIKKFGSYGSPPGSGNAYRRTAIEGYFPMREIDWKIGADTLPALVAPFQGEVVNLNSPGGFYRIHNKIKSVNTFVMNNSPAIPSKAVELAEYTRKIVYELLTKARWLTSAYDYEMPAQVKLRLISLRVNPEEHPISGDTRWKCLIDGIKSILHWPGFSIKKRLLYTGWFIAVAILPKNIAKSIILTGMNRKS
ncbi:glycosyltransferase family 2 protein [Polynucleobacter sp. 71A-WALBACH]|uniref:glycosyltransferase family 2 protein n=1 Tax=Polynucleobacter sp. 71A-WALBACH TaxID=2689097 RepID=UPI001C0B4708|nr:glycosyltransferase family A protein [Polynucleobacter sp. 71A-WALBACH]MBU3593263.1 glycosyltransferase family 2 protein [Polynucleobacter sp. 71A-WALBACH]